MTIQQVKPTTEIYSQLDSAVKHFNDQLFEGKLPACVLTLKREKATQGYFSPDRWSHTTGKRAHEISLNPSHFADKTLLELFQTVVHEQCHLWQYEFGAPSRPGYHNTEWADKMESIGLIPSDTGQLGGKRTGQRMSDFPAQAGRFKASCQSLIDEGFEITWIDRGFRLGTARKQSPQITKRKIAISLDTKVASYFANLSTLIFESNTKSKKKITYRCASCSVTVWGRPELTIFCGQCNEVFRSD
jgi:predicted SprT family Zn-dependent metalloprotease